MQDGTPLDPNIFIVNDNKLEIQTNDKDKVGQYPIKASAVVPGYPISEVSELFKVNIIDYCDTQLIEPETIPPQEYVVNNNELQVRFDEYKTNKSYCP